MKSDSFVEVIYIGANNKIISSNFNYAKGLTLNALLDDLVKKSIFSKEFLHNKNFGCYGKIISMSKKALIIYPYIRFFPADNLPKPYH